MHLSATLCYTASKMIFFTVHIHIQRSEMEDADTVNSVYNVGKLSQNTTADYELDPVREFFYGIIIQSVA